MTAWDVFKGFADTGLRKSVDAADQIDDMIAAHYEDCIACQNEIQCGTLDGMLKYRDSAMDMAVDYIVIREALRDGL